MKKTIAEILLSLALAGLLTACTGSSSEATSSTEATVETETEIVQAEEEETEETGTETIYEQTRVKLGIMGPSDEVVWDPIIADFAKLGVTIEKVFFTDYTQPNAALDNGEVDLDSFQTHIYLETEKETFGYDIVPIGNTMLAALNLYSSKIGSIEELEEGDTIALPGDAISLPRGLRVLQAAGLITLDPDADSPDTTDVIENPLNLEFVVVDSSQTPSLLPDVAAAIINGGYAIDAGLSPADDAIFHDDPGFYDTEDYINVIAARTEDKDNPLYLDIVKAYQSDRTKEIYANDFQGAYLAGWEN